MDKIVLKTFTSNLRKLSWQKFHDYLACEFTAHYVCRTEIYNYQRIQPSNKKFIKQSWGVRLTCPGCKRFVFKAESRKQTSQVDSFFSWARRF